MRDPDIRPSDLTPLADEMWDTILRAENELEAAAYDIRMSRYAIRQHFHAKGDLADADWQALVTAQAANIRAFDLALAKVNTADIKFRSMCKDFHTGKGA